MNRQELIRELSDYARKQLERKKKFALVNNGITKSGSKINETGEIEIQLTGKQVKELDTIFKKFNSDLGAVLDLGLDEKTQPEYSKMSSKELEEMGVAIKIDESIMDGIEEILELGNYFCVFFGDAGINNSFNPDRAIVTNGITKMFLSLGLFGH